MLKSKKTNISSLTTCKQYNNWNQYNPIRSSSLIIFKNFSTTSSHQSTKVQVMLLGPPGVGKGTYASRTSRALQVPHIAAGDIIRDEIKSSSKLGKKMRSFVSQGELVPDELIFDLLSHRLEADDVIEHGFLLDGFPRNVAQAKYYDEHLPKLDKAVHLTQRQEIIVEKLSSRRICNNCGTIYNMAHIKDDSIGLDMPAIAPQVDGVCDHCGSTDIVQRPDDRESVVRDRLLLYEKETAPLVQYYEGQGILQTFPVTGGAESLLPDFITLLKSPLKS